MDGLIGLVYLVEAPSVELSALVDCEGSAGNSGPDVGDEGTGGVGELADLFGVYVLVVHAEVSLSQLSELIDPHTEHRPESAQHKEVPHPTAYLSYLPPSQQQARALDPQHSLPVLNPHCLFLLLLLLRGEVHFPPPRRIPMHVAYYHCVAHRDILCQVLLLLVAEPHQLLPPCAAISGQSRFALSQQVNGLIL